MLDRLDDECHSYHHVYIPRHSCFRLVPSVPTFVGAGFQCQSSVNLSLFLKFVLIRDPHLKRGSASAL